MNTATTTQKINTELLEALELISGLDPERDSTEGFNEWGEADCFRKAVEIAAKALAKAKGEK
ncbi:MAG: hypothetical protein Q7N50_15880 [Armatimonadota bacterium]|nr:hypothetical protein [Armatimonadota bacterium]